MFNKTRKNICIWLVLLLALGAAACSGTAQSPAAQSPSAEPTLTLTQPAAAPTETTIPSPTPTEEPLALLLNGEGLTLAQYEAELRLLEAAHESAGKVVPPKEQANQLLDYLIETMLLAQGAAEAGYSVDDAALQAEIDRLDAAGELAGWLEQYGYSDDAFRAGLRRQMAAAWQRDQIIADVPAQAEQVRVRQILAREEQVAKRAYDQVHVPGVNFAAQAFRYDPVTGGDLGWFPRGYLLQPEVEAAAFEMQPGEISQVIQSSVGYHVIQVAGRETRPLSPDARRVLQHQALRGWLDARRAASAVEIILP